jgi:hypothetical protein
MVITGQSAPPRFGSKADTLETSLRAFRARLLQAVDAETALAKDAAQRAENAEMHRITPMWGQCVPVSIAVKNRYGGQLVRYELNVQVKDRPPEKHVHWANQVDGRFFDLTSDQYNGDGLHAVDDPQYGIVGRNVSAPVPVNVLAVLKKKTQQDFYYGQISNRSKLLAKRLDAQA